MNTHLPTYFHGTNSLFDKFEAHYTGKSSRNPTSYFGYFFTDSVIDALSWAKRASRHYEPENIYVIEAKLNLNNPKVLTYAKFHWYLQIAKTSTIQKHKEKWMEDGFDGLSVIRDGKQWFAAFDVSSIEIIDRVALRDINASFDSEKDCFILTNSEWKKYQDNIDDYDIVQTRMSPREN